METVGICLACYKGEKYLHEQLESLVRQTYSNFICYIQDDGSPDNTLDVIESFIRLRTEKNDMRFKLVSTGKHQGVRDNFLSILKMTTEKYVMFCDQDDVWLPEKIKVTLNAIKALEEIHGRDCPVMVFTDLTIVDEQLNILKTTVYDGAYDPYERDWKRLIRTNNNFGNTEMMNRTLVDVVNGIDTELPNLSIHDSLVTSVAALVGKIEYLPIPTILYRQHGHNAIGAKKRGKVTFADKCMGALRLIIDNDPRWGCNSVLEFAAVFHSLPNIPVQDQIILDELVCLSSRNKLYRMWFYKKNGFYHGIRLLWA